MNYVMLNNGMKVSQLGLGTYGSQKEVLHKALDVAWNERIHLIDTSPNYNNDQYIGEIFRNYNRESWIIVDKLDTI